MKWERVRKGLRCAFGCDIPKDALVLFWGRMTVCRKHARNEYHLHPPRALTKKAEPVVASDVNDGRMRATPAGDR